MSDESNVHYSTCRGVEIVDTTIRTSGNPEVESIGRGCPVAFCCKTAYDKPSAKEIAAFHKVTNQREEAIPKEVLEKMEDVEIKNQGNDTKKKKYEWRHYLPFCFPNFEKNELSKQVLHILKFCSALTACVLSFIACWKEQTIERFISLVLSGFAVVVVMDGFIKLADEGAFQPYKKEI